MTNRINKVNRIDRVDRVKRTIATTAMLTLLITPGIAKATKVSDLILNVNGTVALEVNKTKDTNYIVQVTKGEDRDIYHIDKNRNIIPLTRGAGEYEVNVLENVEGNKYKLLKRAKFKLNGDVKDNQLYTASINSIDYANSELIKGLSEKSITDKMTDKQKVESVYNYIISNIKYDHDIVNTLQTTYVPSIDNTIKTGKGICYDYSSLVAGLLRYNKIPTKLVKGHTTEIPEYHAWNEVYLDGKWEILDATIGAAYYKAGQPRPIYGDSKLYTSKLKY